MKKKTLILIYNYPSDFSSGKLEIETPDRVVTINRLLFDRADIVIFYLLSLQDTIEEELEKSPGQYWVGWYFFMDPLIRMLFSEGEFIRVFDLLAENPTGKEEGMERIYDEIQRKKKDRSELEKQIQSLGNIYLCSFSDSHFVGSLERLYLQAEAMAVFREIFLFTEYELDKEFREQFSLWLHPFIKGFGYWCWKPYIILKCLNEIEEGDILLYLDAGCHLNPAGIERFVDYWKIVKEGPGGMLLTELKEKFSECNWTKQDVFTWFGIEENNSIRNTPQYQSGIIFIRKEQQTVELVKQWLSVFSHSFHLIDDSPSISPNPSGFKAHRHDQSILSVLAKKQKAQVVSVEEFYTSGDWDQHHKKFPILIKRDL